VASYGLGRLGRVDAALDAAARGYEAGQHLDEPDDWYPWFNLYARCEALALYGRFAEAETLAREQYDEGLREGSSEARAWFLWHRCRTTRERGNAHAAARDAREAITLLRRLGRIGFEHSLLSLLAQALALAGDHRQANHTLETIAALTVDDPRWSLTDYLGAQAWTAVAEGRISAAKDILFRAADTGERIGDNTGAAAALHDIARLGAPRQVADRLRGIVAKIDGDLAAARIAHVAALCETDAGRLGSVATAFTEIGAELLAAEAAADAALAARGHGNFAAADAALHRAATLAERCGGAITPALAPIASRERLTQAEYETAVLACNGHTSKQIASELQLSTRTIENRLARIYTKVGVHQRSELAIALGRTADSSTRL
jgi:DNA-binding CsgD family transcriptional regulator